MSAGARILPNLTTNSGIEYAFWHDRRKLRGKFRYSLQSENIYKNSTLLIVEDAVWSELVSDKIPCFHLLIGVLRIPRRLLTCKFAPFPGVITDISTLGNRHLTGSKQVNIRQITDAIHEGSKHHSGPALGTYANYGIYARQDARCRLNAGNRCHDFGAFTLIPAQLL